MIWSAPNGADRTAVTTDLVPRHLALEEDASALVRQCVEDYPRQVGRGVF